MRSGNKFAPKNIKAMINLKDYIDHHIDDSCSGHFELVHEGGSIDSSAMKPFKLSRMPFIKCNKCNSKFVAPKFEEWLFACMAEGLIIVDGLYTKEQIKFLRQHFEITQDEMATLLSCSKFQISRFESNNAVQTMSPELQFRMRAILANRLGKPTIVKRVSELSESQKNTAPKISEIIPSEDLIERATASLKVAN